MWSDMPAPSCHHVPPQARSAADGDFFFYIEGVRLIFDYLQLMLTMVHSCQHTIPGAI